MGTGILIFRQVMVTIVVAENDTPIWLQIERSNPTILAPQLLWCEVPKARFGGCNCTTGSALASALVVSGLELETCGTEFFSGG